MNQIGEPTIYYSVVMKTVMLRNQGKLSDDQISHLIRTRHADFNRAVKEILDQDGWPDGGELRNYLRTQGVKEWKKRWEKHPKYQTERRQRERERR